MIEARQGDAAGRELDRLIDKAGIPVVAVDAGEPLLFKGDDVRRTDVARVV